MKQETLYYCIFIILMTKKVQTNFDNVKDLIARTLF